MSNQQPPPLSLTNPQGTALAERPPSQAWAEPQWERFWLNVNSLPWRTLALVPAGDGAAKDFTLMLAMTLSRTGMSHVGGPIMVADGMQVPLNQLKAFLEDVRACKDAGERVIIALSAVGTTPTIVSLAKAADGVLLCVLLENMRPSEAKKTIKAIGPSKFFGSVIVHPNGTPSVSTGTGYKK